jgi:hypothetical protein
MNQDERLIQYKRIRRFLRNEVEGMVSQEAIEFCQIYLENMLKELCKRLVSEHQEQNELRKLHGLPEHKRIGVSEFLSLCEKKDKETFDLLVGGIVGQHNRDTSMSQKQEKEVVEC